MPRRAQPLPPNSKRCAQCWQVKPLVDDQGLHVFVGPSGKETQRCNVCRDKYGNWNSKTPEEKAAIGRRGVPVTGTIRARLTRLSHNEKLGGIPASMTSRTSCPPSCSFYGEGCYAEYHVVAHHWRRVGEAGDTWADFLDDVRSLPPGQLWRHNVAGDLPGHGEVLDVAMLSQLVEANRGRRGFTFTHKHASNDQRLAIRWANVKGLTINLSADNLDEADELVSLGVGPVAVVLPEGAPDTGARTPEGRRVVVCPAERGILTCASCQLCAVPHRRAIVGFRAHGQSKARVSELVQLRRKPRQAEPTSAVL